MESGNRMLTAGSSSNYTNVYAVQKFVIKNNGDRIYKDVLVRTSNFRSVIAEQNGKVSALAGDNLFTLNPGDTITVSGVSDGYTGSYGIEPASKILIAIGDRPIPIHLQRVDEFNPLYPLINIAIDYPFATYLVAMVLGIILFLTFLVMFLNILVAIFPSLTMKIFSAKDYFKEIAILNHIKKADPERYAKMVKKAEKFERDYIPQIESAS